MIYVFKYILYSSSMRPYLGGEPAHILGASYSPRIFYPTLSSPSAPRHGCQGSGMYVSRLSMLDVRAAVEARLNPPHDHVQGGLRQIRGIAVSDTQVHGPAEGRLPERRPLKGSAGVGVLAVGPAVGVLPPLGVVGARACPARCGARCGASLVRHQDGDDELLFLTAWRNSRTQLPELQ